MATDRFWQHFLALESDFSATSRYVEFSKENFKTYSIEFSKLLLAIGSEVDVVCKEVCEAIAPGGTYRSINDYRDCISVRNTVFNDKVVLRRYELEFQPWRAWHGSANPSWWKAYNDVKHNRSAHFQDANLENCANSISGLFAMVLYYLKATKRHNVFGQLPQVLGWHMEHNAPNDQSPYHIYAFGEPTDKAALPLL